MLLLNASFEPLGVVPVPRAVRLMWTNRAEMVEQDGVRELRSQHMSHPQPSVIRLLAYVNIHKRRNVGSLRMRVILRDKFRCQYCGVKSVARELTMDHILPRSRGGRTHPENLAASCKPCNARKGDRTPQEARMPLLAEPSALVYDMDGAALRHAAESRPEWRKYVFPNEEEAAA